MRSATAALVVLVICLVTTLFASLIAGLIADAVHSVDASSSVDRVMANARLELGIRHLSPDQLYQDATGVLLNPQRRSTGIVLSDATDGSLPSNLPLTDHLQLAWWQLVPLAGGAVALFAGACYLFMRQEVRAQ